MGSSPVAFLAPPSQLFVQGSRRIHAAFPTRIPFRKLSEFSRLAPSARSVCLYMIRNLMPAALFSTSSLLLIVTSSFLFVSCDTLPISRIGGIMNNLLYYQRFAHHFGQGISRLLSRFYSLIFSAFSVHYFSLSVICAASH